MQTRCTQMPCVPSIVLFCTVSSRGFSVTSLSWWEDELKQGIDYNSSKDKSSENWQQIREFPQPEWALWGHLRSWLGWRNPKDGLIFFHYQLRACGVTPTWSSSIRCPKCGGVRLCHCTSMCRWGILKQFTELQAVVQEKAWGEAAGEEVLGQFLTSGKKLPWCPWTSQGWIMLCTP